MTIEDYIKEFKSLLDKKKSYGTNISSDVQEYGLLKSASISVTGTFPPGRFPP